MNIVITGTSRGIGLELVSQALQKGHRVLAVARRPEASAGLQSLKRDYSDRLEVLAASDHRIGGRHLESDRWTERRRQWRVL